MTYANTRYLRHVPDDRLNSRANDIEGNFWTTDASGTVIRLSEPPRREFFMKLYAELHEEQRLRSGGQVIDLDDEEAICARASAAYTAPQLTTDPPPLKWSDLRYVFDIKEDCRRSYLARRQSLGPSH
jgi:hypothetical protein